MSSESFAERMKERVEDFGDEDGSYAWDDDRSLRFGHDEIEHLSEELELPEKTKKFARDNVFDQAHKMGIVRGRSVEGVVCASVYIACRMHNLPRSLDEIADHSRLSKDKIVRTYKHIAKEFGFDLAPVDPHSFVPRLLEKFTFRNIETRDEIEEIANEILDIVDDQNLMSGKDPAGVAGAAIYIAADEVGYNMTQSEIARAADVSEVTIRFRYQEQQTAWDEKKD